MGNKNLSKEYKKRLEKSNHNDIPEMDYHNIEKQLEVMKMSEIEEQVTQALEKADKNRDMKDRLSEGEKAQAELARKEEELKKKEEELASKAKELDEAKKEISEFKKSEKARLISEIVKKEIQLASKSKNKVDEEARTKELGDKEMEFLEMRREVLSDLEVSSEDGKDKSDSNADKGVKDNTDDPGDGASEKDDGTDKDVEEETPVAKAVKTVKRLGAAQALQMACIGKIKSSPNYKEVNS